MGGGGGTNAIWLPRRTRLAPSNLKNVCKNDCDSKGLPAGILLTTTAWRTTQMKMMSGRGAQNLLMTGTTAATAKRTASTTMTVEATTGETLTETTTMVVSRPCSCVYPPPPPPSLSSPTGTKTGGGVVRGGGSAVILPGIDKNDNELNMNTTKRATNMAKTAAKSKAKTNTSIGGK